MVGFQKRIRRKPGKYFYWILLVFLLFLREGWIALDEHALKTCPDVQQVALGAENGLYRDHREKLFICFPEVAFTVSRSRISVSCYWPTRAVIIPPAESSEARREMIVSVCVHTAVRGSVDS